MDWEHCLEERRQAPVQNSPRITGHLDTTWGLSASYLLKRPDVQMDSLNSSVRMQLRKCLLEVKWHELDSTCQHRTALDCETCLAVKPLRCNATSTLRFLLQSCSQDSLAVDEECFEKDNQSPTRFCYSNESTALLEVFWPSGSGYFIL